MKLTDLEAEFVKITDDQGHEYQRGVSIKEADGVLFLCPKCFSANNGPIGTHRILCWQPHVPQTISPRPGRWKFLGTGLNDLELKAGSSSVLLTGGCNAHFFVRDGEIVGC